MATLGSLKARIIANLRDRRDEATTDSRYVDSINDAIAYYVPEKLWFQEFNTPISVMGTGITLPSDFAFDEPWTASIFTGTGATRPLSRLGIEYLTNNYNFYTGYPIGYVYDAGVFTLVPQAGSTVYTVNLRGWKNYVPLSADGASNDFTLQAAKLIEYTVTAWLWSDISGDSSRSEEYLQKAGVEGTPLWPSSQLARLRKLTNLKRRTGAMAPDWHGTYNRSRTIYPYTTRWI